MLQMYVLFIVLSFPSIPFALTVEYCLFLVTSYNVPKCINPREYVPTDDPIVFVIGAMAHGSVSYLCLQH